VANVALPTKDFDLDYLFGTPDVLYWFFLPTHPNARTKQLLVQFSSEAEADKWNGRVLNQNGRKLYVHDPKHPYCYKCKTGECRCPPKTDPIAKKPTPASDRRPVRANTPAETDTAPRIPTLLEAPSSLPGRTTALPDSPVHETAKTGDATSILCEMAGRIDELFGAVDMLTAAIKLLQHNIANTGLLGLDLETIASKTATARALVLELPPSSHPAASLTEAPGSQDGRRKSARNTDREPKQALTVAKSTAPAGLCRAAVENGDSDPTEAGGSV
jgi:hypothetical protein